MSIDIARVRQLQATGVRRLYLGGPMTGYAQFNFPAFDAAAAELREAGFEIISPAELDDPATREITLASVDGDLDKLEAISGERWEDFLARDIILLANPDVHGGVVLPGWTKSKGANFEAAILKSLGKPVVKFPTLSPVRHQPRLPYQTSEE